MFRSLFARLTAPADRGARLFAAVVQVARQPHWYVEGKVEDSLEGRFAVLATVTALVSVRLDGGGPAAQAESVALSERFVESIDAELRQLGVGDPSLARQVRKLVASLGRRVGVWRGAVGKPGEWMAAAKASLYPDRAPGPEACTHSGEALRNLWEGLQAASDEALIEGNIP